MTGAFASEPGSREPSPAVSAASGFDPSRSDVELLLEALEGDLDWLDALSQGTIERDMALVRINAHRALIAKARGNPA